MLPACGLQSRKTDGCPVGPACKKHCRKQTSAPFTYRFQTQCQKKRINTLANIPVIAGQTTGRPEGSPRAVSYGFSVLSGSGRETEPPQSKAQAPPLPEPVQPKKRCIRSPVCCPSSTETVKARSALTYAGIHSLRTDVSALLLTCTAPLPARCVGSMFCTGTRLLTSSAACAPAFAYRNEAPGNASASGHQGVCVPNKEHATPTACCAKLIKGVGQAPKSRPKRLIFLCFS